MCQQCGHDTRRSGLRQIDGICISCWHDRAKESAELAKKCRAMPQVPEGLLDDIDALKGLYGNNLPKAPSAVQRIIAFADKQRGRNAVDVPRPISRSARVQR